MTAPESLATREVDLLEQDVALREALSRYAPWGTDRVRGLADVVGSAEAATHCSRAEHNAPRLRTHDQSGNRVDEVDCDPSWSWLLRTGIEHGVSSLPFQEPRSGAFVVRNALGYLLGQINTGVLCPLIMTLAAVPVLVEDAPDLAKAWVPRLIDPDPDRCALAGQAYTEKQSGSDLRRTATRAVDAGDGSWRLWGDKWFASAPMADIFLTLAQTPAGLTCFLVERGEGFHIARLKEKLGTHSLPTGELEFRGVRGWPVGELGHGMAAVVRNLGYARLGPAVAPEMRAAVVQAIGFCRQRETRAGRLANEPAMTNVLADLALESEAATSGMLRLAAMYDDFDSPLRRLTTSVLKYWGCSRVTGHVAEAMQCLGGNGYTESFAMARLLRDSAVHPIWEGSGNVTALDVLRTIATEPLALDAFLDECEIARGADARLDAHLDRVRSRARAALTCDAPQFQARRLAEDLALALHAGLLVRHSSPAVADAYCAGRLDVDRSLNYGALPSGIDANAITARALPY